MKLLYRNKSIAIACISIIIIISIIFSKLPYMFTKFICWLGYCEENVI